MAVADSGQDWLSVFNEPLRLAAHDRLVSWITYQKEGAVVEVVFTMTCPACGEAYDATIDGEYVGHVRLRWGHFCAHKADNTELFRLEVSDDGFLGCFYPDLDMRDAYLTVASEALARAAGMDDGDVFVSIENYYDYDNEWDFDLSNFGWTVPEGIEPVNTTPS